MLYGFRKIGIVSSIPGAGTKPGTGTATDAYKAELGSVLEITAKCSSAVAGTLTLLRWFPPPQTDVVSNINVAGEWRKWREDVPIEVPAVVGENFVSGRYEQPDDSTEYWLLLGSHASYAGDPEVQAPTVLVDAQSVYYRGRK